MTQATELVDGYRREHDLAGGGDAGGAGRDRDGTTTR